MVDYKIFNCNMQFHFYFWICSIRIRMITLCLSATQSTSIISYSLTVGWWWTCEKVSINRGRRTTTIISERRICQLGDILSHDTVSFVYWHCVKKMKITLFFFYNTTLLELVDLSLCIDIFQRINCIHIMYRKHRHPDNISKPISFCINVIELLMPWHW